MSALLGAISSRVSRSVRSLSSVGSLLSRATVHPATFTQPPTTTTTWVSTALSTGQFDLSKRFASGFHFHLMPSSHPLSGKGDPYTSQLERKRVVKDPNVPNFEFMEPLKWTTWRMLRDVRRRHVFTRFYLQKSSLYNVRKCRMLPKVMREAAFDEEIFHLPRDSKFHHLRNRCAISGRSRGVLKKYRLSRLVWRNLADYNKLSGVIKACWT